MSDAERLTQVARRASAGDVSDADVAFLVDCLGRSEKAITRAAAELLAELAPRRAGVEDRLRAALTDTSPARRWGAAYALARVGPPPPESLPVLLEVLGSRDGDVRWAAADVVKRFGAGAVTELLHLATAGVRDQRKMALYCLRDLGVAGGAMEAALQAGMADADTGVRLAALSALGRLTAHAAALVQAVLRLMEDADPGVRRAAANVLGLVAEPSALVEDALRRAAATADDPGLRRAADRAMRRLGINPVGRLGS